MKRITREHVLDILARADLRPEQEQTILAPYPVELNRVTEVFAWYGVTKDWLISLLGGCPCAALIVGRHARSRDGQRKCSRLTEARHPRAA